MEDRFTNGGRRISRTVDAEGPNENPTGPNPGCITERRNGSNGWKRAPHNRVLFSAYCSSQCNARDEHYERRIIWTSDWYHEGGMRLWFEDDNEDYRTTYGFKIVTTEDITFS